MTSRAPGRLGAALPLAAVLGLAGAATAYANPPDFDVSVGVPSVFADGQTDVGVVTNRTAGGGQQQLSEARLGLGPDFAANGSRFGAALLRRDLNGDEYFDLVAGSPGTPGSGSATPGRVAVVFGSPTGLVATDARSLEGPGEDGDRFGAALAVSAGYLWVGAPGADVGGLADAGAVYRYRLTEDGSTTYVDRITQDSAGVPGDAEGGDHFGAVLATAENGVLVGVPDEDVGGRKDAGVLDRLKVTAAGGLGAGADWTQGSPGVPGDVEAGDRFGATVTQNAGAVGVPGEDVGSRTDAGMVQTFGLAPATSDLVPSGGLTQDSAGIPGDAEAGDRFGAALTQGVFGCQEHSSVAVGAPGEDVGTVKDAGSVTEMPLPFYIEEGVACPATVVRQGRGLPGVPEAGDRVGAALGTVPGDPDDDEDYRSGLLVGDPGEDVKGVRDAGRVYYRGGSFKLPSGDVAGIRYGSVLPG